LNVLVPAQPIESHAEHAALACFFRLAQQHEETKVLAAIVGQPKRVRHPLGGGRRKALLTVHDGFEKTG
jgi:hypothetical protein